MKSLVHRRDVFAGDSCGGNVVLEFIRGFAVLGQWNQPADHVGELPRAAGLLFVTVVEFGLDRRGLSIADLWNPNRHLGLEFPADPFDVDVQVQLSHACDNCLARFRIGGDAEGGVFFHESAQGFGHAFLVGGAGRRDRQADHRHGHKNALQRIVDAVAAERVSAGTIGGQQGDDIAGTRVGNVLAVVCVHSDDAADALHPVRTRVAILPALSDPALIDANVAQLPERFIDDLEDHRHQRPIRIGRQRNLRARIVVVARKAGTVQRAGKEITDRVQQRLDAFVLERRSHHQRHDMAVDGRLANCHADHLLIHGLFVQQLLHHLVVEHAQGIEHLFPRPQRRIHIFRGNRLANDLLAVVARESDRLHCDKVDDASKIFTCAHADLKRHHLQAELVRQLLVHPLQIGADAVHLIDKSDARHAVALHLLIDRDRLALDAAHGAENHNGPVQHAQ